MSRIDVTLDVLVPISPRVRQLEAMFDVPPTETSRITWSGDVPLHEQPWSVGLIVGPSWCGKSTLAAHLFGRPVNAKWDNKKAVIDNFPAQFSLDEIVAICQSVGFNTIPAWMRPRHVLSNGEQFRVELARKLIESTPDEPCVMDEFTSVVDRQVGKIASHAVQKWVRRNNRQFVAVTCHSDVVDWLQPDWTLEPGTMTFTWRSVQPRPQVAVTIGPVPFDTWSTFSRFHYLTSHVHRSAKMFAASVNGEPVAIAAVLHQAGVHGIKSLSRLVTLPDWQGMGLAFVLADTLGAALRASDWMFHMHPAHPSLIRSFDRSANWTMRSRGGGKAINPPRSSTSLESLRTTQGRRPAATFRYCGQPLDKHDATRLLVPHLFPHHPGNGTNR